MKKIAALFLTFLGICTTLAQKALQTIPSDSSGKVIQRNDRTGNNDTLPIKEKPSIRLFPNPAVNKVEIEIKGFEPGYLQAQLIDMNGRKLRDEKRFAFTGGEMIVLMFSVKPGIYLLMVQQNKRQAGSRLIVQ